VKIEKIRDQIDARKKDLIMYLEQYIAIASPEGKALGEKYRASTVVLFPLQLQIMKAAAENNDDLVASLREKDEAPILSVMDSPYPLLSKSDELIFALFWV